MKVFKDLLNESAVLCAKVCSRQSWACTEMTSRLHLGLKNCNTNSPGDLNLKWDGSGCDGVSVNAPLPLYGGLWKSRNLISDENLQIKQKYHSYVAVDDTP